MAQVFLDILCYKFPLHMHLFPLKFKQIIIKSTIQMQNSKTKNKMKNQNNYNLNQVIIVHTSRFAPRFSSWNNILNNALSYDFIISFYSLLDFFVYRSFARQVFYTLVLLSLGLLPVRSFVHLVFCLKVFCPLGLLYIISFIFRSFARQVFYTLDLLLLGLLSNFLEILLGLRPDPEQLTSMYVRFLYHC